VNEAAAGEQDLGRRAWREALDRAGERIVGGDEERARDVLGAALREPREKVRRQCFFVASILYRRRVKLTGTGKRWLRGEVARGHLGENWNGGDA
jgi:hypothetical protein